MGEDLPDGLLEMAEEFMRVNGQNADRNRLASLLSEVIRWLEDNSAE